MRIENMEVVFRIPMTDIDSKYKWFSQEAIMQTFDTLVGKPIMNCSNGDAIGVVKEAAMEDGCIVARGTLFFGGTSEAGEEINGKFCVKKFEGISIET